MTGLAAQYVYHGAPGALRGSVLYPLNDLKVRYPDLYEQERAKYAGRESALDFYIPHLGVLWNDTVHCSPLHPYHLFEALQPVGYGPSRGGFGGRPWFRIPIDRFEGIDAVWYRNESFWVNNSPGEDVPMAAPEEEFEPFNRTRYQELKAVPERHLTYLRRMVAAGRRGLMFAQIPHVLVAGPIDVSGLVSFSWETVPKHE